MTIKELNALDKNAFVQLVGPCFENSPWIAERAFNHRPFRSRDQLHQRLVDIVRQSTELQKLALIRAHPDLVGKLAQQGKLTKESSAEQAAANLTHLTPDE